MTLPHIGLNNILLCISFLLCFGCFRTRVINQIEHLQDSKRVTIENHLPFDTAGGHLQGIQIYKSYNQTYALTSGSSNEVAYLAIINLQTNMVEQICTLFVKPLKHAGGFQISGDYLAVGVEDNERRTQSKIAIYRVDELLAGKVSALNIIDRQGGFERSTAGCVAFVKFESQWIIVVGDWNTRHLDIYANEGRIDDPFSLMQTLSMSDLDRSNWSDPDWLSYQTINMIMDDSGLWLAGLTSSRELENAVDIFRISGQVGSFVITKMARKTLANTEGHFVWSAGLMVESGLVRGVMSSARNLDKTFPLYIYQ